MRSTGAVLLTLLASVACTLASNPTDFWQKFQRRERPRSAPGVLEIGPYAGPMLGQYYPFWAPAAVLQLDDPSGRLADVEDRLIDNDYGYELDPDQTGYIYGDENDNMATGVEEQVYKDLLMRYLLREMEKQDALPVVRRRSEYQEMPANVAPQPAPMAGTSPSSSTSTTTSTTTVKPPTVNVVKTQKGQKEVALLRPPSENHHRALAWPQELEDKQPQKDVTAQKTQEKRFSETAALPTAPKKQPKQAIDILTDQLNTLRAREH